MIGFVPMVLVLADFVHMVFNSGDIFLMVHILADVVPVVFKFGMPSSGFLVSSCSALRVLLTWFHAAVGIITIASRWTAAVQWCPVPGGGGCWPLLAPGARMT